MAHMHKANKMEMGGAADGREFGGGRLLRKLMDLRNNNGDVNDNTAKQ